jgi:hypothetical protein
LIDWIQTEIADKPASLIEPLAARFSLLWLNGATAPYQLAFLCEQLHLRCIAPQGGDTWWVDRICPAFDPELTAEKHILQNVVPWIEERYRVSHRSIAIAGMEVGGQGAIRLALKYSRVFRVAASINGAFDFHELYGRGTPLDDMYESKERCRQDTATLHMHPSEWPPHLWFACDPASPWFRGNDRLHEKLRAYGVPHIADLETGGNLPMMLQFIFDSLERESRRLM